MTAAQGISAFVDGARSLRRWEVQRFVWLPAAISLIVIVAGGYFTFDYLTGLATRLSDSLPEWLDWLDRLLAPLLYLLGVVLGAWLFALLAVVVASPFLGLLSAAVERHRFGDGPHDADSPLWREVVDSLRRELRKLAYHLPRLLGVFILTLLPVFNLVAPAIWLLFGAWTMAVQFVDYPVENRKRPFEETLGVLRKNRAGALAFGACAATALAIPFLNFALIPVAVAGGTLFWRDVQGRGGE